MVKRTLKIYSYTFVSNKQNLLELIPTYKNETIIVFLFIDGNDDTKKFFVEQLCSISYIHTIYLYGENNQMQKYNQWSTSNHFFKVREVFDQRQLATRLAKEHINENKSHSLYYVFQLYIDEHGFNDNEQTDTDSF
ncbi:unnamed protein product [Didymodactylos carnosus]|uniref:Uncharacterized protein n=1 Tax=Didymodactylos carnosus TaxID=1234261 RepID=A0A814MVR7_9BILA|nr:unnamed protein product [Didymodactylos carnosus]CAF1502076.1 unnamed protein product [Didymodactylos carnosus]CAF3849704.1 unnamed protein product [Didymodactylos carnosus]CAF4290558.1 unnamed protein product [Didymodactylos carnosus]